MNKPLILITNDDGIQSLGIHSIANAVSEFADVVVAAPTGPRSAQSSALTIDVPVSVQPAVCKDNIRWISINGTPADCVKIAITQLLDRKPDLVISGINHGSNASINVIYSGTMGAAIEGSLHGIPSIGLSLCDHKADADFTIAMPYFVEIIKKTLQTEMPKDVCLNVNAPLGEIRGVRVCHQAEGRWLNDYAKAQTPRALDYYWLIGDFSYNNDDDITADQCALDKGYMTVVPVQVDMTAYPAMQYCKMYETEA